MFYFLFDEVILAKGVCVGVPEFLLILGKSGGWVEPAFIGGVCGVCFYLADI
jgi:hypothetical protein